MDTDTEGFITHDSVREVVGGVSKSTLLRWEQLGRFPRRVHLSTQRPVWRTSEVRAFLADPAGWIERNRQQDAG